MLRFEYKLKVLI